MNKFNFQNLEVYKIALELTARVFDLTKNWPKEYLYDLTSQFRRAILSIPLNIAEGSSRSKKDFQRFIDMARGSCYECVPILEAALNLKIIDNKLKTEVENTLVIISKMLSRLKTSLS